MSLWISMTWASSAIALSFFVHTSINLRFFRTPQRDAKNGVNENISVLLPVRNEAHRVEAILPSLEKALDRYPTSELVVLDDESNDGTADLVRAWAGNNPRITVRQGEATPHGWLGKPWACHQLSLLADPKSTVLVFIDADVDVAPAGLKASIHLLRDNKFDVVCPYPRQLAHGWAERLVQPLLQWSWLTTLPLRIAEKSPRPSLTAANGQFLAVDRDCYYRSGGHAAIRCAVLDDLALVRMIKKKGGCGGVADGTVLATCRMYDGWASLRDGYTKSLWAAFGSPLGALSVVGCLLFVYVWPTIAALTGSFIGLLGYGAGVASRILTGQRTASRIWPDALAHPVSIGIFCLLVLRSLHSRRQGTLQWKGRPIS
ncbi:MAG: glycosyltransferase [Actinomycetota bacterium]